MRSLLSLMLFTLFVSLTASFSAFAGRCGDCKTPECRKTCDPCCGAMGGVQYCDSSAGRFVCNNGFYSSCYCDRHAVMDLQNVQGCCLYQGGVLDMSTDTGVVICNNGTVSEICSLANPPQSVAAW